MLNKFRQWLFGEKAQEQADEESRGDEHGHDQARDGYEGYEKDQWVEGTYAGGATIGTDFERDSDRPG